MHRGGKIKKSIPLDTQYYASSTLYPNHKRLESAKCVTVYAVEHNGRLRKYYRITEAGRGRIRDFLAEWQDVMRIYRFIEGGNTDDEG